MGEIKRREGQGVGRSLPEVETCDPACRQGKSEIVGSTPTPSITKGEMEWKTLKN